MMLYLIYLIDLIVWIIGFLATYPALFSYFQAGARHPETKIEMYREDLGVAMLLSLFPPSWLVTPFLTGFYKHGFKFK